MFFRIFRSMSKLALRLFFRRIEVEGLDRVPESGPLLLVPNHTNAMVDPLIPLVVLRRPVTLTGKSVLTRNPLLALIAKGIGAVVFHRRADVDKGADPRENSASLDRCREILGAGGAICIFPEGVSHSDVKMRTFRTGPARIALDFVKTADMANPLRIVPVGLLYTAKSELRSDVLMRFGSPIDVVAWCAEHGDDDVLGLNDEIRRAVERVTLDFDDRKEMLAIRYAADLVATAGTMPRPLGNRDPSVAESFERLRRLRSGYRELMVSAPDEVESLVSRLVRFRSDLRQRGIDPAEVYLPLHPGRAALFLVRELELLIIGAPLAMFGVLNHLIPYLVLKKLASLLSTDPDHWATNVIYPGFFVVPAYYLVFLSSVWWFLPAPWAILYTLAAPCCGYYALLYLERAGNAWTRARTFTRFLVDRETQQRLVAEGRDLLSVIDSLSARVPPSALASPLPTAGA